MGPGGSVKEGSLDHVMVCFGVGLRLSESNIGEESLVAAANIVTLGPSNSPIFHILEPCCIAHILIAASLSKVWYHTLELSIGSHKIKDLLLTIQISGVIGIQINIKISHKDWSMSIGGVLIKGSLDMCMEIPYSISN